MKIIKKEYYRSTPKVNMADDSVRITITAKRNEFWKLEKFIKQTLNKEVEKVCVLCGGSIE